MGNKDKSQNQHSQGGGHSYERARSRNCGKKHEGKYLAWTDGCFACGNKGHKIRDFPKVKARDNDENQDSLDPNATNKNLSYGMGARKDN